MCTPDLKGTQGSFSQFTTRVEKAVYENGSRYPLRRTADGFEGEIEGPEDTFIEGGRTLRIPFRIARRGNGFELRLQGRRYRLEKGEYTDWLRLSFRTVIGAKVAGIAPSAIHPATPLTWPACWGLMQRPAWPKTPGR
jgi:hypothetical protein